MKFKESTRKIPGEYTPEGATRVEVTRTPVLPKDMQALALKAALGIVLGLTLIAVAWSTWSIGNILGGGIGFAAAMIFDLGWAVALLLEYLARYDENKRAFPEKLGWALLVVTMVAIGWDGVEHDSWAMAVIGAFVSLFAKALWMGVMKHVNAQLTDQDKDALAREVSAAQTKAAVAQVRRTTSRIEQRAALELLAMEAERRQVSEAFGLGEAAVQTEEPVTLALAQPTIADMGKADAIKFVMRQLPEATAEEIHEVLQQERDDTELAYVRQVIKRTVESDTGAEIIPIAN